MLPVAGPAGDPGGRRLLPGADERRCRWSSSGEQSRRVQSDSPFAYAWGDPPVVLVCGVDRPAGYVVGSRAHPDQRRPVVRRHRRPRHHRVDDGRPPRLRADLAAGVGRQRAGHRADPADRRRPSPTGSPHARPADRSRRQPVQLRLDDRRGPPPRRRPASRRRTVTETLNGAVPAPGERRRTAERLLRGRVVDGEHPAAARQARRVLVDDAVVVLGVVAGEVLGVGAGAGPRARTGRRRPRSSARTRCPRTAPSRTGSRSPPAPSRSRAGSSE